MYICTDINMFDIQKGFSVIHFEKNNKMTDISLYILVELPCVIAK